MIPREGNLSLTMSWQARRIGALGKAGVVAICLLLLLATTVACDPGATIKYVNETDKTVIVYTADDRDLSDYDVIVDPHSTVRAGTIIMEFKDVVILRDKDGNLLMRKEITWDELKAQDFRFVISEEMLSPTPTEDQ
jgi:hypothetical protein